MIMRDLAILTPLVLAAGLSAQMRVSLVAETDVGVFANNGTQAVLKSVKKGTAVKVNTRLRLHAGTRGALASAGAGLGVRGRSLHVGFSSMASVSSRATKGSAGTAATTDPKNVKQAPHSFLLTLAGAGLRGFEVTFASRIVGKPVASASIDIGADGSVEFKQAADGKTYRKKLAASGASVKVRITLDGSAKPGESYGFSLSLVPARAGSAACSIRPYGRPCPRTTLAGRDVPTAKEHVVTLHVAHAIANKPVALVIGPSMVSIRLPGSRCRLLTRPAIVIGLKADSMGRASSTMKFPLSVKGTGYLQAIPFDPSAGRIAASNGLRIDCR